MGLWKDVPKQTLQLIEAAAVDRLDDEQFARLEQLICDDSTAARYYLDYMQFEVDMHLEAYQQRSLAACRETIESLGAAAAEYPSPAESSRSIGRLLATTASRWVDWRTHPARFTATVLTLTLVFWAVVMAVVWPRWNEADVARQPFLQEEQFEGPIVARVLQVVDAQWDGDPRRGPMPGTHLRQGRRLALKSGLVHLCFSSGAKMFLQGPANFTVRDMNAGDLTFGSLIAKVPHEAVGFTIKTPNAMVTDLGTKFGLEVSKDGELVTHVFEGAVQLCVAGETHTLAAGKSAHWTRGKLVFANDSKERFEGLGQLVSYRRIVNLDVGAIPYRGVGVLQDEGTVWNQIAKASTPIVSAEGLVDSCGNPTKVGVTIASRNQESPVRTGSAGTSRVNPLTQDYAHDDSGHGGGFRIEFHGLLPGATYDLALFGVQEFEGRPGSFFTIAGHGSQVASGDFSAGGRGFWEGDTHVVFRRVSATDAGEIVVTVTGRADYPALFNGVQIGELKDSSL